MAVKNARSMRFSATPQLFEQVETICAQRGCTRNWFLNQAVENYIAECLEDKADYEAAIAAWEEYEKSGFKSTTAASVFEKAGI